MRPLGPVLLLCMCSRGHVVLSKGHPHQHPGTPCQRKPKGQPCATTKGDPLLPPASLLATSEENKIQLYTNPKI